MAFTRTPTRDPAETAVAVTDTRRQVRVSRNDLPVRRWTDGALDSEMERRPVWPRWLERTQAVATNRWPLAEVRTVSRRYLTVTLAMRRFVVS